MCRNLISVDWRGFVYDCDFNQMLDLPLQRGARERAASRPTCSTQDLARQSDPRRRALLWLHRRTRLELRRRAQGGGASER